MKLSKLGLVIGGIVAFSVSFAIAADLTSKERKIMELEAFPNVELADRIADTLDDSGAAVGSISYTVAAESNDAIVIAGQLKSVRAVDLATRGSVFCYVSSDSAGDTPVATFEAFVVKFGGDGSVLVLGTNARLVVSESDGDFDVEIQETGTTNYYLNCVTPNGEILTSGIVDFS